MGVGAEDRKIDEYCRACKAAGKNIDCSTCDKSTIKVTEEKRSKTLGEKNSPIPDRLKGRN